MTPPPAATERRSRKPLLAWLAFLAGCAGLIGVNGVVELRQAREASQWRQQTMEWNARAQRGYNDLYARLSPMRGLPPDEALKRSEQLGLQRDVLDSGRVIFRVPEGVVEGGLAWTVTFVLGDDGVVDFNLAAARRPPPRPPSMLSHVWKRATGALPVLAAVLWVAAAASALLDRRGSVRYGQYALAAAAGGTLSWVLYVGVRSAHPFGVHAGAALAAVSAGLVVWGTRRREVGPGACAGCGYDLTGNVSGVCPECGRHLVADGRTGG